MLFAKLLAFAELLERKSVNTVIWEALEDWVSRQPKREQAEAQAPAILAARRKKRAARKERADAKAEKAE